MTDEEKLAERESHLEAAGNLLAPLSDRLAGAMLILAIRHDDGTVTLGMARAGEPQIDDHIDQWLKTIYRDGIEMKQARIFAVPSETRN